MKRKYYLNKQDGKWLGVCAGLADYTGFDITLIRIATFLGTIFCSGLLLIIYLLIAWIADPKPFGA